MSQIKICDSHPPSGLSFPAWDFSSSSFSSAKIFALSQTWPSCPTSSDMPPFTHSCATLPTAYVTATPMAICVGGNGINVASDCPTIENYTYYLYSLIIFHFLQLLRINYPAQWDNDLTPSPSC